MECIECGESYPDGTECPNCRIMSDDGIPKAPRVVIEDISTEITVCPIMTAGQHSYMECVGKRCGLWDHDDARCSRAINVERLRMTIESLIENMIMVASIPRR